MSISTLSSHEPSSDRLRRVPQLEVRRRIDDIIPDIRPCTLRELQIFGRGFNPGTSSVDVSAFVRDRVYKEALINNLSAEQHRQFLTQLALIFGYSYDELEKLGLFCYNVARGYNNREDVPAVSFKMGIADDGYV